MAATPLSMKEAQPAPSVEEIVRTLVQVVPTPVLVVDADLHPVYVNPAASELLGGGDEALVGSDLMDFLVRRERDEVSSYLRSSATDQPGRRSMTVLDRNGQEREVVLHHTRLELGGQRLLAGIIEDVTETRRVRREAVALAQSAASLGINRSLDATLEALAQSVVETTSAIACGVYLLFFFQAEDGIRDLTVTGVQTCALPISQLNGDLQIGQSGIGFTGEAIERGQR